MTPTEAIGEGMSETARRNLNCGRHYVRRATAWNNWFDFSASVIDAHRRRFGDDFCLVIDRSGQGDDVYVLPWPFAARLLLPQGRDYRGRWCGTVIDGVLRVPRSGLEFRVDRFHNAFELLRLFGGAQESASAA